MHENNILVHVDGAQLWHATATTNIAMSELCAPFNSISLCFSKGLGAPMGYLPGWVKSVHSERICLAVRGCLYMRVFMAGNLYVGIVGNKARNREVGCYKDDIRSSPKLDMKDRLSGLAQILMREAGG
ncbi:hypothetical protein EDC04DRAFT_2603608 [Pisolithus marmoratus]|nr:hypothetical protein EDC04DRAFT_2603608 [Pisolithus marmoratus]